jgi:hypothetical protein
MEVHARESTESALALDFGALPSIKGFILII